MGRPKKIVDKETKEETTPMHEARLKETAQKQKNKAQSEIKEEWYEFGVSDPLNKKGRKVIRSFRTTAGVMTTWVGWEKKIPITWIKSMVKLNMFKNLTHDDQKRYGVN